MHSQFLNRRSRRSDGATNGRGLSEGTKITMKFQILNRWTAAVQFECELGAEFETQSRCYQLGAAVKLAYASDAALRDADLRGTALRDAALRDADLRGADLSGAVLSDADLSGAALRGADLSGAVLSGADLSDADLSGADLSGA